MANVGNLFINVTGNTKGLTKALGSAKSKLATFDRQVGRPRGDFMRRARGRFYGAMAERQRFSQQMSQFIGPQRAGYAENIRGRMGKKESGARRAYRAAQREEVMGRMTSRARMYTSATLGVLGLTIGAVGIMARKGLQQVQTAKQGAEQFAYLGPKGAEIVKADVDTMMAHIEAAQDPAVSQAILDKKLAGLSAIKAATASGGTILSLGADSFFERMGEAFINAMARGAENVANEGGGLIDDLLNFRFMGQGSNQPTGYTTQGASAP